VYEPERMHLSHTACAGLEQQRRWQPDRAARGFWPGFSSLPRTRSLFGLCARIPMPCPHDTLACTGRSFSRSLAETARVTITTGFPCVSTLLEAGDRSSSQSRGARDRSCTTEAVQSQLLLPVAQDRQSIVFCPCTEPCGVLTVQLHASSRMAVNSLLFPPPLSLPRVNCCCQLWLLVSVQKVQLRL
jgi:hypothetical protein